MKRGDSFGNRNHLETTITGLVPLTNGVYQCEWEGNTVSYYNNRGVLIYTCTTEISIKGKVRALMTVKDFVATVKT